MDGLADIFVSYRSVSLGWAVTLDQALRAAYGDDRVFRAGRSIAPGSVFEDVILTAASGCRLMVCVVGPTWLATGTDGVRLVDRKQDYVRREITAALQGGAKVVPVLVDGAARLSGVQLPDEISGFSDLQSEQLRGQSVDDDLARILGHLFGYVEPLAEPVQAGPPPDAEAAPPRAHPSALATAPEQVLTLLSPASPFVPRRTVPRPGALALLIENLLAIPEFRNPDFRNDLTTMLRIEITGGLARSQRARAEAVNLVGMCARFPNGLLELLDAVRVCAGDSPEVRMFHAAVAEVL